MVQFSYHSWLQGTTKDHILNGGRRTINCLKLFYWLYPVRSFSPIGVQFCWPASEYPFDVRMFIFYSVVNQLTSLHRVLLWIWYWWQYNFMQCMNISVFIAVFPIIGCNIQRILQEYSRYVMSNEILYICRWNSEVFPVAICISNDATNELMTFITLVERTIIKCRNFSFKRGTGIWVSMSTQLRWANDYLWGFFSTRVTFLLYLVGIICLLYSCRFYRRTSIIIFVIRYNSREHIYIVISVFPHGILCDYLKLSGLSSKHLRCNLARIS